MEAIDKTADTTAARNGAEPVRIGRPRKEETKRAPLNMKTTPELRARLEAAAAMNNRPMTQQAEAILESYLDENLLPATLETFIQGARQTLAAVIKQSGNTPQADFETYIRARAALQEWLDLMPSPASVDMPEWREANETESACDQARADYEREKASAFPGGFDLSLLFGNVTGLGGFLSESMMTESERIEKLESAAEKASDTESRDKLQRLLPLSRALDDAEAAASKARRKLIEKLDNLEREARAPVRERLAALRANG